MKKGSITYVINSQIHCIFVHLLNQENEEGSYQLKADSSLHRGRSTSFSILIVITLTTNFVNFCKLYESIFFG